MGEGFRITWKKVIMILSLYRKFGLRLLDIDVTLCSLLTFISGCSKREKQKEREKVSHEERQRETAHAEGRV